MKEGDLDGIARASGLAQEIVALLQRDAATLGEGERRTEIRYAEALARTLGDQLTRCAGLAAVERASGPHPPREGGLRAGGVLAVRRIGAAPPPVGGSAGESAGGRKLGHPERTR